MSSTMGVGISVDTSHIYKNYIEMNKEEKNQLIDTLDEYA